MSTRSRWDGRRNAGQGLAKGFSGAVGSPAMLQPLLQNQFYIKEVKWRFLLPWPRFPTCARKVGVPLAVQMGCKNTETVEISSNFL